MSRRLIISDQAEIDIEAIADHIANDNPLAALRLITLIRAKCAAIASQPLAYAIVEQIGPDFRRALVKPFGIWFRVADAETVIVERVVHGARDLPSLFES